MPAAAELDLDAAMKFDDNSPFTSEETCAGWRVIAREGASLDSYVIAARAGGDLIVALDSPDP